MNELRRYLTLLTEDAKLKKQVIDLVKSTDDEPLLQKVYNALSMGDLPARLKTILSKDADASKFVEKIANTVIAMDYPTQAKEDFAKQFPKGFIDIDKLLDGNRYRFSQIMPPGLPTELFKILTVELASHGVGPGEVALAVLSPKISWSGRAVGGGDIQIGNKAVEVKTTVSSGGRWMNPRKAKMNMSAIAKAMTQAIMDTRKKNKVKGEPFEIPDRINTMTWVDQIRPQIDPSLLPALTKVMADSYFNQVDNSKYQKALMSGSSQQIREALLDVGYKNYKKYSGFNGMLLMDVKSESAQYFEDLAKAKDSLKVDTAYVYAPETEAMPKVTLLPQGGGGGVGSDEGSAEEPAKTRRARRAPEPEIKTHAVSGLRPKTAAAKSAAASSPRARR